MHALKSVGLRAASATTSPLPCGVVTSRSAGRSDLANFLEVPITAVRNWERGKSRPADSQAVLDQLTKIQENLERAYLDTDENGGRMLWVEETDFPITVNSEEAGARLFFLRAPHAMGIRAPDGRAA